MAKLEELQKLHKEHELADLLYLLSKLVDNFELKFPEDDDGVPQEQKRWKCNIVVDLQYFCSSGTSALQAVQNCLMGMVAE